ncbi:MAG: flavin monoamine oxidase family protein [Schleiferiaceae bacterium]
MSTRVRTITLLFSSSLLVSSCMNWAARAVENLPEVTALDKSYEYSGKVIIVGAGPSGLAAAKILERNQIDYLILEATDRFGGRLKKDTTLADFPIDLGAEWIHSNPIVLNKIKGLSGTAIEEDLIPYHLESAAKWNGNTIKEVSKAELDFRYRFLPESKFKSSTWYDFVEENLAKSVQSKIHFNSAVTSIDYSDDEVMVKTVGGKTYKADRVLVTVSVGVLKSEAIEFTPALDVKKKKAIASINFRPGLKVALKFSDTFYHNAIECASNSGERAYYDIALGKETESNILGFLCTGEESRRYIEYSTDEALVQVLLEELDQMYTGRATELFTGEYRIEKWSEYEFTRGTWTQAFEESPHHLRHLNRSLMNKVFFAGEINDPYRQMGVPGAILSGYHSIDELLSVE